ncbi:MAG: hypothetical protein ACUVX8_12010, partial [Candidatus Zipacnadales bacterium]
PDEEGLLWHWGRFYQAAQVLIPPPHSAARPVGLAFHPVASVAPPDHWLTLWIHQGQLHLSVQQEGSLTATAEAPVQGETPVLVTLHGNRVTASYEGQSLLSYELPAAPLGREVALHNASSHAPDEILVTAPNHFQDYPFSSGPTDWYQGKGTWDLTTRWHCDPGWTFLGGTNDPNPVLWTKHAYRGDVVCEFFGALRMDESWVGGPYAYLHPSDINLTLCGDGQTLRQGYSFILAGWNNTRTAILRNGEIVAERSDVLFTNPTTTSAFHHHWFRVRAEKLGDTVRYWVDGQPVLEYRDPEPLAGGRIALWTFHNSLMVARARLWYAQEEQPGGVVRLSACEGTPVQPTPRPAGATEVFNDFETDSGEWTVLDSAPGALLTLDNQTAASGQRSLRITNTTEGGPLTIYPLTSPFRLADWPMLSFDYRLPPEIKLNLYLYTNERWHVVQLTAPGPERSDVTLVGAVALQADHQWHHVEIPLLQLLKAKYPQFKIFQIKQFVFCPPWDSYVRCGIGGNPRGAHFWIDNFRLGPAR